MDASRQSLPEVSEFKTVDQMLNDTQARIRSYGSQGLITLDRHLQHVAGDRKLFMRRITMNEPGLDIDVSSFSYGADTTAALTSKFVLARSQRGATLTCPAREDIDLREHTTVVHRLSTPNVVITAPMAAKVMASKESVLRMFSDIGVVFASEAQLEAKRQQKDHYGTDDLNDLVVPSVIGSMHLVGRPEVRLWRNAAGDLLFFRVDVYLALSVLPGLAHQVMAEDEGANDGSAS